MRADHKLWRNNGARPAPMSKEIQNDHFVLQIIHCFAELCLHSKTKTVKRKVVVTMKL